MVDISKTSFGDPDPDEPLTLGWLKRQVDAALERGASPELPVLLRVTDSDGDTAGDGGLTAARIHRADRDYANCFLMDAHVDVGVGFVDMAIPDELDDDKEPEPDSVEPEEPGLMDVLDDPMSGYDSRDEDQEDDDEAEE